jgi:alpha-N-arabinofuranosidase
VITVHAGVYRECVSPPRGGESDAKRIIYQAAPGEKVEIKGSEVVKNWEKVQGDTWKVTLPNSFFGKFNPYSDLIHGDWFDARERAHHTGAVYLNGEWLNEAARLDDVMRPAGPTYRGRRVNWWPDLKDDVIKPVGPSPIPQWFGQVEQDYTTIWAQFKLN